jgi:hypothetical protein
LGNKSAEQETPILRIFTFQGPSRTQTKREFSGVIIFLGATK